MEKLKLHTPNLVLSNIDKIASMFPGCITEGHDKNGMPTKTIDFDQLRQALSESIIEGDKERYRLDWPGKREALVTANSPIAKTLRPCRNISVEFDKTKNIFIEGDNLDALKLIREAYLGQVKVIFIDPPYNTGNDFIYEDDFSEDAETYLHRSNQKNAEGFSLVKNTESNGRFHSDWLSMIYARLMLAQSLLRDDGAIFISIDDGEVGNLRKVCDQVFGENNFVANIIWEKKYTRANDAKWFSDNHDHILCYARNKELLSINLLPRNEDQIAAYANPDNHPKGKWKATPLHAKSGTNSTSFTFKNGVVWVPPPGTFRRFNDQSMKQMDDSGEIWFGADGKQIPSRKSFLSEVKDGVTPITIWPYSEVGHNHEANTELKQLGMGGIFNNPKPIKLIQRCVSLVSSKYGNDIILDFFAGSATTAHAVMEINARDADNKRFILVQIPESCDEKSEAFKSGYKNISEIAQERIRRAGSKIKSENSTTAPTIDVGYRVLKIDSSNFNDVYYQPDSTKQADLLALSSNIREDRTPEDLLFQVMLDWGVDLGLPICSEVIAGKKVFFVDGNALAACFDTDISEDLVTVLAKRRLHDLPLLKVVFRDAGYVSDSAKINVEQIFKLLSPTTELRTL